MKIMRLKNERNNKSYCQIQKNSIENNCNLFKNYVNKKL